MHYGDLNNLFYKNPSAILKAKNNVLPIILENNNNLLELSFENNKSEAESDYMIFPLETPCLTIQGKTFDKISLENIETWLLNVSDYPYINGKLNTKLRVKFRINDELIEGQTVQLHDNDIVEVKIVGF